MASYTITIILFFCGKLLLLLSLLFVIFYMMRCARNSSGLSWYLIPNQSELMWCLLQHPNLILYGILCNWNSTSELHLYATSTISLSILQLCDGPIEAFTVLHNVNCCHGLIYVTSLVKNYLNIFIVFGCSHNFKVLRLMIFSILCRVFWRYVNCPQHITMTTTGLFKR